MFAYWAYVLIGNNDTGKTSFQRNLVFELSGVLKGRLATNLRSIITHPRMPRGVETLSTMNRSYQEKIADYGSVSDFFANHFQDASICILSSHTHAPAERHLQEMITELRLRHYNVAGVFFSNGNMDEASKISLLDWDDRLWVENPRTETSEQFDVQIRQVANEFSQLLIARASVH